MNDVREGTDVLPEFHGVRITVKRGPADDTFDLVWTEVESASSAQAVQDVIPRLSAEAGKIALAKWLALLLVHEGEDLGVEIFLTLIARAVAPYAQPELILPAVSHGVFRAVMQAPERNKYFLRTAWWYLQEKNLPQDALEYIGHGIEHCPRGGRSAADAVPAEQRGCAG